MNFLKPSIQSYCLYASMIVYGCFSSPTPDHIGIAEIIIALLLCMSIRLSHFASDSIQIFLFVSLGYGLIIPLITAFVNGQDAADIIRDLIPFLYLMIPLFLGWIGTYDPQRFLMVLALIGISFSFRTIISYQPVLMTPSLWGKGPPADLLYLANSPEVLFSALYCLGQGGKFIMERGTRSTGVVLLACSLLPMVAMALMMQRAGIGSVVIYIMIAIGFVLYHRPKWGMIFMISIFFFAVIAWNVVGSIFSMIEHKTEIVGLNARAQEWSAVFDILFRDWTTCLFGEGWGGRIESPAVGGLNVNYTHSLISSLLLKTGLIGAFIILLGCLAPVLRSIWRIVSTKQMAGFHALISLGAAIFPLTISVFLYASYKSLGFGLILLVFFILPIRKLEKNQ